MSIHHTWFFALYTPIPIAVTGALAFHIQAVSMSYTPMPIAVTGPGCFNKTEPAALESDKGSDEPDPCA